jgi:hypothetical protein
MGSNRRGKKHHSQWTGK